MASRKVRRWEAEQRRKLARAEGQSSTEETTEHAQNDHTHPGATDAVENRPRWSAWCKSRGIAVSKALSTSRHQNLRRVKSIGTCSDVSEQQATSDMRPGGSPKSHSGRSKLPWGKRTLRWRAYFERSLQKEDGVEWGAETERTQNRSDVQDYASIPRGHSQNRLSGCPKIFPKADLSQDRDQHSMVDIS